MARSATEKRLSPDELGQEDEDALLRQKLDAESLALETPRQSPEQRKKIVKENMARGRELLAVKEQAEAEVAKNLDLSEIEKQAMQTYKVIEAKAALAPINESLTIITSQIAEEVGKKTRNLERIQSLYEELAETEAEKAVWKSRENALLEERVEELRKKTRLALGKKEEGADAFIEDEDFNNEEKVGKKFATKVQAANQALSEAYDSPTFGGSTDTEMEDAALANEADSEAARKRAIIRDQERIASFNAKKSPIPPPPARLQTPADRPKDLTETDQGNDSWSKAIEVEQKKHETDSWRVSEKSGGGTEYLQPNGKWRFEATQEEPEFIDLLGPDGEPGGLAMPNPKYKKPDELAQEPTTRNWFAEKQNLEAIPAEPPKKSWIPASVRTWGTRALALLGFGAAAGGAIEKLTEKPQKAPTEQGLTNQDSIRSVVEDSPAVRQAKRAEAMAEGMAKLEAQSAKEKAEQLMAAGYVEVDGKTVYIGPESKPVKSGSYSESERNTDFSNAQAVLEHERRAGNQPAVEKALEEMYKLDSERTEAYVAQEETKGKSASVEGNSGKKISGIKDTPKEAANWLQTMESPINATPEKTANYWGSISDKLSPEEQARSAKDMQVITSYYVNNPVMHASQEQAGAAYANLSSLVGKPKAEKMLGFISDMANRHDAESLAKAAADFSALATAETTEKPTKEKMVEKIFGQLE